MQDLPASDGTHVFTLYCEECRTTRSSNSNFQVQSKHAEGRRARGRPVADNAAIELFHSDVTRSFNRRGRRRGGLGGAGEDGR